MESVFVKFRIELVLRVECAIFNHEQPPQHLVHPVKVRIPFHRTTIARLCAEIIQRNGGRGQAKE